MLIDSMLAKEERGECVVHAHTRDLSEKSKSKMAFRVRWDLRCAGQYARIWPPLDCNIDMTC
jgi:hypothetical protein